MPDFADKYFNNNKKKAIKILNKWSTSHWYLVIGALNLNVFNDSPDVVVLYCNQIVTNWKRYLSDCIQVNIRVSFVVYFQYVINNE
jgi:hypothetical protein